MLNALLPLMALTLVAQTPAPKPAEAPKAVPAAPATATAKPAQAPAVKPAEAAKPAAQPAEAPKAAPAEDKILARVGDKLIRQSEMEAALENAAPKERQQINLVQGAKEQYYNRMIEMHLLAAKAKALHLDATPEFKRAQELMHAQLLATTLLKKEGDALNAKMTLTDDDAKANYEAHKDQFKTAGKFTARHILVSIKSERTQGQGYTEDEAKARVEKIQAELKAGKKLEDLAKDYSDDPGSKDKGGLYENINFGQFVPEFENAVKTQPLGQPGAAVKTAFGYHIIQAEKMDSGEVQPFDTVKEQAKTKATESKREKVWNEFVGQIKKEIPFELNPDPKKVAAPAKPAAPAAKPAAKKA
jgi:parvulin-like peptidyl-prolyl isomerase